MRAGTSAGTDAEGLSYRRVLRRNPRLGALLVSYVISSVGDGILLIALPLLVLRHHGSLSAPVAVGLVMAAPYVLSTVLALSVSLGRLRLPLRRVICYDSASRTVLFTVIGVAALADRISFWLLALALLIGSVLHQTASSSRRLVATGMAGEGEVFTVNGLLGFANSLALYVVGPALGGVVTAAFGAGSAILLQALSFLVLLVVVTVVVPPQPRAARATRATESGWQILRRRPVASRLFIVVFFFNLTYMPVEVALPLLVRDDLHGDGTALGTIWAAFGGGALIGGALTGRLRKLPQQPVLVAVIALWGASVVLLGLSPTVPVAVLAFALGGLIYAPFTPVAYTFVQSALRPDEQQPVVTLWTTGSTLAAPIGLSISGPLVAALGARGGLLFSAVLTLALAPIAAMGLLSSRRNAKEQE
ncbi:MFS transporter [Streptomyces sp. NPDC048430]|uniref:MFS transporter n=1 Tax=Streptomyces sp. NPDC048430 TaxID=3155388 RepID=UPI00344456C7